jgi:chemotaxis signal transduction protein
MTATDPSAASFVVLQVGERQFAIHADRVSELAPPVRLHTFPHTTPLLAGVIVRRGRIVPVYDVGPVLLGRPAPSHRFYLVARREFGAESEPSAIPVNGDCELANAVPEPPPADSHPYVSAKIEVGATRLEVLDLESLLSAAPAEAQP